MAVSVVMPALEMAQETGKLLSWRKKEGERVAKGEPLLEIETDKAVVEIEAPADGILAGVKALEGAVVPVGETIAWLVQPGEGPPPDAAPARTGRRADRTASGNTAPGEGSGSGAPLAAGLRISPKARRLAREHGVDPAAVTGSGPGGEILASDVLAAAGPPVTNGSATSHQSPVGDPSATSQPSAVSARPSAISSFARLMAQRTTHSWTTVPHFFLTREIDAGALVSARERRADTTLTDLLVALVARVLVKHPRMNASWTPDGIRTNPDINVAIAIAVADAVVTGVIHRADAAAIADIASRRTALIGRARAGRLEPSDIAGATFTISNLGMFHVDAFTAIIVPGQAGILAVGAIADRVVAVGGQPIVRPMLTLTLSCDHRVVDGVRGAAFLDDLAEAIGTPDVSLGPL